jgi:hypothetical protein
VEMNEDKKPQRRSRAWEEVIASYVSLRQTIFGGNRDTILFLIDNLIDKLNGVKASIESEKSNNEPWS